MQDDLTLIKERRKETADILYEAGAKFYEHNELSTAKDNLEKALISNPYHKKANQLLAKILIEEQKYEEAHKVLERLHKSQPEAAKEQLIEVLLELANLSRAEHGQKAEDEQLQYYQDILELDSNNEVAEIQWREIWQQRGNEVLRIENESDFEQALNQASDKDLDDALRCYQKGKLRKQVNQIDAEQHRRTTLAGWYQQAKKALDEGDKFKAQQRLIQVINEKPTYGEGEAIRYLYVAVTDLDPLKLQKETKQLKAERSELQDEKRQLTNKINKLNKLFKLAGIGVFLIMLLVFIFMVVYDYYKTETWGDILQKVRQQEEQQRETETKNLYAKWQSTSEKLKVFDNITKYKRFIVATRPDFSPFSYLNEKGERIGFEVDIVREFARRWFKDETAVILRPMIADYDIDSLVEYQSNLVTTVANTEKLSQQLDFSVSYFQDNKRLLVRQNSDIEDFCDIKGKRIAIVKGSLAKDRLQAAVGDNQCSFAQILEKHILPFETHSSALEALRKDKVEVMVADKIFLEKFLKDNSSNNLFKMVFFSIEEELYSFGVLKGNERFLNLVNYTLQEMKNDNTYAKIYCKWFQTDKSPYNFQFLGFTENELELVEMAKAKLPSAFEECPKEDTHQQKNDNYPKFHIVQKNDSLWDLAEQYYKNPFYWKHIRQANKGKPVLIENTPSGIKEGETLIIPEPPN